MICAIDYLFATSTIYRRLPYFLSQDNDTCKIDLRQFQNDRAIRFFTEYVSSTVLPSYVSRYASWRLANALCRNPRGRHVSTILLARTVKLERLVGLTLVPRIGDVNGAPVSKVGAH